MATIETIANIMEEIQDMFPNWEVNERKVSAWKKRLLQYDDEVLRKALDTFVETSGSPFPPELPVFIKIVNEVKSGPSRNDLNTIGMPKYGIGI